MRILFVSHIHPPEGDITQSVGGMQRVSGELLCALHQEADLEVIPLLLQVPWSRIGPATARFLARLLWTLPGLVKGQRADLVLFTSMVTASILPLLRPRIPVPCVAIAHGLDVTMPLFAYQRWIRRVFASLDLVVAPSRATIQACQARGLPAQKGAFVPNGIDLQRFAGVPPRPQARRILRELGYQAPAEAPLLLSLGRWVRRKGFAWFLQKVFPHLPPQTHYALIGDGPEREAIREAARPFSTRIWMPGKIPEAILGTAYAAADLFVMPNIPVPGDMEGFGIVLLEAALCSTPVLASRLEGIQDAIQEPEMGWMLPPGEAPIWIERLSELLADRSALHQKGAEARRHVETHYSWSRIIARHRALWAALSGPGQATAESA